MSPRRRLVVLAAVILVLAVAAAGGAAALRRHPAERTAPVPQNQPGPVLLVTGYGGGMGSLQVLAAALRATGRQVAIVPVVGDGTGDLQVQAQALAAAARARIAAGAPSVDVVGFSAGGVVARVWATDLGGAAMARRIVTLAAPHHGTELAGIGATLAPASCPTACRQLAPDSDLLARLGPAPTGPGWVSLWSQDDQVVVPPGSARLNGALDVVLQRVCPNDRTPHGGLPADPAVIGIVERALAVAPMHQAPPPGDCAALRAAGAHG